MAGHDTTCVLNAPLGSSPAAVVSSALSSGLPSISSAASSTCSDADALEVATPSSSGRRGAPAGSVELAVARRRPDECGSVRSKAAYFEALCRANTTMHIQCTADGPEHCKDPASGGGGAMQPPAGGDVHMAGSDSDEEAAASWQDFSEVHLLLRMPRPRSSSDDAQPGSSTRYGSVSDMEQLISQLQEALELKEAQRRAAVDAFTRRSGEVENLQRVVRELSESRCKAVSQRALLAERYNELQQEYARMLRIADLSRTVSKENMAATSRTRSELRRVQSELHATKNHALSLTEKHLKVRTENAQLKERVQLLQRLDLEDVQESEIKKHFTRYRLAETY